MRPLSRHTPGGLIVVQMDVPAERTIPTRAAHEGHEWLYVLAGRLRLVLGDDDLILEPGEAAEFSTWTPHWMGAVDGPPQALAIFGPQGERVHMRAARPSRRGAWPSGAGRAGAGSRSPAGRAACRRSAPCVSRADQHRRSRTRTE